MKVSISHINNNRHITHPITNFICYLVLNRQTYGNLSSQNQSFKTHHMVICTSTKLVIYIFITRLYQKSHVLAIVNTITTGGLYQQEHNKTLIGKSFQ